MELVPRSSIWSVTCFCTRAIRLGWSKTGEAVKEDERRALKSVIKQKGQKCVMSKEMKNVELTANSYICLRFFFAQT